MTGQHDACLASQHPGRCWRQSSGAVTLIVEDHAGQGLLTGAAGNGRRHADPHTRRQQRDALREQRRRWIELGELGDLPGVFLLGGRETLAVQSSKRSLPGTDCERL